MKNIFILLALTMFLAACSDDDNSNGGNCKQNIISDYNSLSIQCNYIAVESQARSCLSEARSFINKYPSANCKAKELTSDQIKSIRSSDVKEIIRELESVL